jgi:hypothetical protein
MDKTLSPCDCGRHEALSRAERAEAEAKELEKLLGEATRLLFVRSDKPSRELFGWWFRRDFYERQRAQKAA